MSKLAQSSRRSLHWRRPKGLALPQVIETAIARLNEAFDARKGALYTEMTREMPCYVKGKVVPRQRAFRSDAAPNFCALLTTLIATASLQTGYVARPVNDRWERRKWCDLDGLAYGPTVPGERSIRRTERHARELQALGLMTVRELRIKRADGYESMTAVKRIALKLWRLLGLEKAVMAAGQRQKQERGDAAAKERGLTLIPSIHKALKAKPTTPSAEPAAVELPPKPKPVGRTEAGRAALAAIAETLGLRKIGG